MDVLCEVRQGVAVIVLRTEYLDASSVEEFKGSVASILESNKNVVLDLSGLQFVDSAGLGALLSCLRKTAAAGGDLKVSGLTKPVRSVFEISRLHRVFDIYQKQADAVLAFTSA